MTPSIQTVGYLNLFFMVVVACSIVCSWLFLPRGKNGNRLWDYVRVEYIAALALFALILHPVLLFYICTIILCAMAGQIIINRQPPFMKKVLFLVFAAMELGLVYAYKYDLEKNLVIYGLFRNTGMLVIFSLLYSWLAFICISYLYNVSKGPVHMRVNLFFVFMEISALRLMQYFPDNKLLIKIADKLPDEYRKLTDVASLSFRRIATMVIKRQLLANPAVIFSNGIFTLAHVQPDGVALLAAGLIHMVPGWVMTISDIHPLVYGKRRELTASWRQKAFQHG